MKRIPQVLLIWVVGPRRQTIPHQQTLPRRRAPCRQVTKEKRPSVPGRFLILVGRQGFEPRRGTMSVYHDAERAAARGKNKTPGF